MLGRHGDSFNPLNCKNLVFGNFFATFPLILSSEVIPDFYRVDAEVCQPSGVEL
jgi:hypothetical protein